MSIMSEELLAREMERDEIDISSFDWEEVDVPDEDCPFPDEEIPEEAEDNHLPVPEPLESTVVEAKDSNVEEVAVNNGDSPEKAEEQEGDDEKAAEGKELSKIAAMNSSDVAEAALGRINKEAEQVTQRDMKISVAKHIQALCKSDPAFARTVMSPKKSIVHCFWYINRMAGEYMIHQVQNYQEFGQGWVINCDVPDGLCYKWAEDYYKMEVPEDDEKSPPLTRTGRIPFNPPPMARPAKLSAAQSAKKQVTAAEKKPAETESPQLSLFSMSTEKAG